MNDSGRLTPACSLRARLRAATQHRHVSP